MFAEERKVALEAVAKAARLCVKIQNELVSEDTITKKDRSPVTVADYASQAVIIKLLTARFDYPFIAEESGNTLSKQPEVLNKVFSHVEESFPNLFTDEEDLINTIEEGNKKSQNAQLWWTLDPIDGTLGFLRRGQYAIALALMEDNKPALGILGCPDLPVDWTQQDGQKGVILCGVKDSGSFQYSIEEIEESCGAEGTGKKISTSDITDVSEAVLTESFVSSHSSHNLNDLILNELNVSNEPVRIDSQCKYSLISRGDVSLYLRLSSLSYKEKIWDQAAGHIVATEAGGVVTDFLGNELDYSQGHKLINNVGVCCTSSSEIHQIVLKAIEKIDPVATLSAPNDNSSNL